MAYIDIDSLLAGVRQDQAGRQLRAHKIAGKQVLRRGLSPLATTISTDRCAGDRRERLQVWGRHAPMVGRDQDARPAPPGPVRWRLRVRHQRRHRGLHR